MTDDWAFWMFWSANKYFNAHDNKLSCEIIYVLSCIKVLSLNNAKKHSQCHFCDLTVFVDRQYQIPKRAKKKKILLLTFIQGQDVGMVILRHGDNGLPGESSLSALVYGVSADAWRGGASPVNRVPGTVISQALNRTHIYRKQQNSLTVLHSHWLSHMEGWFNSMFSLILQFGNEHTTVC